MRKSQYNEEQIIGILREAEGDTSIKVVCARHNVSEATFYKWRAKYGGLEVKEALSGVASGPVFDPCRSDWDSRATPACKRNDSHPLDPLFSKAGLEVASN